MRREENALTRFALRRVNTVPKSTFQLSVLGRFELSRPDGPIDLASKKLAALLAFLACTAPRVRWVFVIARQSSFIYKIRSADVKQIGRELGVRYLVEGSVRKSGTRVRIVAQLIETETGAHIWADRY